jgi:hydantoinase/carbamoylase family amidase
MEWREPKINASRLRADLFRLGQFGEEPDGGIMREALSQADREARAWFKERMKDAGMEVREDEAANIIGRLHPHRGTGQGPCIAVGSHIDAVPHGGKFDGAAGLCAALEALRAIQESGLSISQPLELLVFTDEEGSHYAGTFGSRAMLNLLAEGEIYRSKGKDRASMAQDLERLGKDPQRIHRAVRSPSEFLAFLELHIEQGPILDQMGVPIGIVEGIVGIHRYLIHVEGKAGHAGTVPMKDRDDALLKAAQIIQRVHQAVVSKGSGLVGTIGELKVFPGAFNIIPGRVEMSLDLRAMREEDLQGAKEEIERIVASMGKTQMVEVAQKHPVAMDREIQSFIETSCRERGIRFHRMQSGAGHDAMTFPVVGVPAGMIFIPCREGKSHCPEEAIRFEDLALGTQILADTVLRLSQKFSNRR